MGSPTISPYGSARPTSNIRTSRRDEHWRAAVGEADAILPSKQKLFHVGQQSLQLVAVLSGLVALWRSLADGRRQQVELVGSGGYAGFYPSSLHGYDCETLTKSLVKFHTKRDLLAPAERLSKVIVALERQLDDRHRSVTMLGRLSAREQIAASFLRHTLPVIGKDAVSIRLPLTRGEIADRLGLSMQTVCRIFANVFRRGIIRICARQGKIMFLGGAELRLMGKEA